MGLWQLDWGRRNFGALGGGTGRKVGQRTAGMWEGAEVFKRLTERTKFSRDVMAGSIARRGEGVSVRGRVRENVIGGRVDVEGLEAVSAKGRLSPLRLREGKLSKKSGLSEKTREKKAKKRVVWLVPKNPSGIPAWTGGENRL